VTAALGEEPASFEDWVEATMKLVVTGVILYVFIVEIMPRLIAMGMA